ncbi:hypothetical protein ABKN59_002618 [Abortiporus biennis]
MYIESELYSHTQGRWYCPECIMPLLVRDDTISIGRGKTIARAHGHMAHWQHGFLDSNLIVWITIHSDRRISIPSLADESEYHVTFFQVSGWRRYLESPPL